MVLHKQHSAKRTLRNQSPSHEAYAAKHPQEPSRYSGSTTASPIDSRSPRRASSNDNDGLADGTMKPASGGISGLSDQRAIDGGRGLSKSRSVRMRYLTSAQKNKLRIKNHLLAMIGEYVGTVLFLFFAFGGAQVANIPNTSITGSTTTSNSGTASAAVAQAPNTSSLQFIALSFGFSLTVNAWVFFRISGGLFNPAISLGLALVGVITPVRAALLSISQFLGGITAAAIIQAILPGPLYVTTRLATSMSPVRGLFLEMFLTAMLMLTIFLLAAEKSKTTFLAPVGIGLALFITQLVGVYYTGASVNPCRTLGPDVVIRSFPGYTWIYYVGPILGTLLAAGFYKLMKVLHYETVVPGQDGDIEAQTMASADPQNRVAVNESRQNPNLTSNGPHLDRIAGPGIGDYAEKGSNLGQGRSSQQADTKYA